MSRVEMESQELVQHLQTVIKQIDDDKPSIENFNDWAIAVRRQMLATLRKRGE